MLFRKILVIICPLIILILSELLFYKIILILPLVVLSSFVLGLFLNFLIKERFFSLDFWRIAVLPFLFYYAMVSLLLFISSVTLKHIVIVAFTSILVLFSENIFVFYYRSDQYKSGSLENLAAFLTILIFFISAISLNAYSVFLSLPVWLLSLILIIITTVLLLNSFWLNKIQSNLRIIYLIIINIIILEFFWALSFLPNNFYINGLVLTIIFYIVWGLLKVKLIEQLEKKIIWRYLMVGSVLMLFIIITSTWT